MKLSELLAEDTVELVDGKYLASFTREEGFVASRRDTTHLHNGQYVFKINEVDDGIFTITPHVTSDDGKTLKELVDEPIVTVAPNTVSYVTGRNHPEAHDVYNSRTIVTVEDIEAGEEAREAIKGFIEFVNSEYSLGVNDFQVAEPEELE